MTTYYETINANVHRGVYEIAEAATNAMEAAPVTRVGRFIGAPRPEPPRSCSPRTPPSRSTWWPAPGGPPTSAPATSSCSPSSNTTPTSSPGSSSRPRRASRSAGSRSPPTPASTWTRHRCRLLEGVKLLGLTAMSNVTGTLTPVAELAAAGPRRWCRWCASTPASTCPTWPRTWLPSTSTSPPSPPTRCSAPPASACCGAREALLEAMPPFLGRRRHDLRRPPSTGSCPAELPAKFEAGTPPVAEVVGLHAAVDYLDGHRHGRGAGQHEIALTTYALRDPL